MRRIEWKLIMVTALLLLPAVSVATAQSRTGRMTGVVKDAQNAVVPGASVLAKNQQTGGEAWAVSNDAGEWTIPTLAAGDYAVSVTAPGFTTGRFQNVKVVADSTATVDATLQIGITETVVVTASRVEEEVMNAPAMVSVVGDTAIREASTQNLGDLLRTIPGVNVMQVSARDFNITPRSATTIPAASQLVMIDGRTINQDYFGYVAWDMNSITPDDIKQVEVLRGPASAVWGANALNGVVNILTKSPRERAGSTFTIGGGGFDRSGGVADSDTGYVFYVNASHAQVINDRWAFKLSGGYFSNDPFARPSGTIPNQYQTPYPTFKNYESKQPKVDGRLDYDFPDGRQHFSLSGGWATTGGVFHTGLGPFRLEDGARMNYGMFNYSRNALTIRSFVNLWEASAWSLLAVGPLGKPIDLYFNNKTWDIDIENSQRVVKRHLLTYGGNYRHNWFELTMAPGGRKRDEGGAYVQDEILLSEHLRWVVGTRVDGFDNLDHPVVSPRTSLLIRPATGHTFRVSYSRAYRVPAMFHNYLDTVIVNALNLGLLNPALAGNFFYFPVHGLGNLNLKEQTLDAYEGGYVATVARGRVNLGATFYLTDSRHDMFLGQSASYSSSNVPAGWPLPPYVLDLLIASGNGLPSVISYQNLGSVRNKGVESNIDVQLTRYLSAFANYTFQAKPVPKDFDISLINIPPEHRFNGGLRFDYKGLFGDFTVRYTDTAYWRDVLTALYAGWTPSYTVASTTVGFRLPGGKCTFMVKVNNLANEMVQDHLFGDLLKRQIFGEMRLRF